MKKLIFALVLIGFFCCTQDVSACSIIFESEKAKIEAINRPKLACVKSGGRWYTPNLSDATKDKRPSFNPPVAEPIPQIKYDPNDSAIQRSIKLAAWDKRLKQAEKDRIEAYEKYEEQYRKEDLAWITKPRIGDSCFRHWSKTTKKADIPECITVQCDCGVGKCFSENDYRCVEYKAWLKKWKKETKLPTDKNK
jgi:hypothetical protein